MKLLLFIIATFLASSQGSPALTLDGARPQSLSSSARNVQISLSMNIHEENIFEDDKEYTRNESLPPILVSEPDNLIKIARYNTRAGGKILVEVMLTVTLRPADLSVEVHYVIELYNAGRDPSRNKPSGYVGAARVVGRDKQAEVNVTVLDTEYLEKTGDKVDVVFRIANTPSG